MTAEMDVRIEAVCSLPFGCGADAVTVDGHVFAFCPGEDGSAAIFLGRCAGEPFDALGELRG